MALIVRGVKFYTVAELADVLGVTAQTIRKYMKEGKLKGRRIGRPFYSTEEEVREFLESQQENA